MKYGDEVIRIGKDYFESKKGNIYTVLKVFKESLSFVEIDGTYSLSQFKKINSNNIIEVW